MSLVSEGIIISLLQATTVVLVSVEMFTAETPVGWSFALNMRRANILQSIISAVQI